MKFKLNRNQLNDILKLSSSVINENALNPILTCILVQASATNNNLHFIFSNERISFKKTIDNVFVDDDFSFCVKSKIFNGILNKLDNQEICFERIDSTLRITTNQFESNINLTDVMLYPEIVFDEYKIADCILKLDNKKLAYIYKTTSSTTATPLDNNNNLILCGIHFETKENNIAIISTDSFRASYLLIPKTNDATFEFVIEPSSIKYVIDNSNSNDEIEIYYKHQNIYFKWGQTISLAKLSLVGNYPNIYNHFDKQLDSVVKIKNQNLSSILEHGSTLVQSEKIPSAKILIDHDKVEIRYQSIDFGSSYETTNWEFFNNINFDFMINIKLLSSILKIYDPQDILTINFSPNKPIIIQKDDNSNLKHLILPLRA